MTTRWVITNAAEQVALNDQKHGETTFTVSNPTQRADRVVFDVVPGGGAEASWFSTNDPQRLVPAGGSVAYLVELAVPAGAAAGTRSLQGRVYSADSAPEESSVLSGRVLFDVAGEAAPPPRRRPWWLIAVAGLVVVVIGVVVWLIVGTGGSAPAAAPAASASPSRKPSASPSPVRVTVPKLTGLTVQEATRQLTTLGLTVGSQQHQQAEHQAGQVLSQSTPGGQTVPTGSKIDLVIGVRMSGPSITSPGEGAGVSAGSVNIAWSQFEPWVKTWRVTTYKESCYYYVAHNTRDCQWDQQADTTVGLTLYTASFSLDRQPLLNIGRFNTGQLRVVVTPADDFGNYGTASAVNFHG